jgi:hypothetical protein
MFELAICFVLPMAAMVQLNSRLRVALLPRSTGAERPTAVSRSIEVQISREQSLIIDRDGNDGRTSSNTTEGEALQHLAPYAGGVSA